ncbi:MAG: hypothetical protein NE334_06340 [Lentisphaeraceae bacterium]|nr:hypothetical protein [Lentisphaeraceae bacterium]
MTKGNKIVFGCLGSIVIVALVSWAAIIFIKNKTISVLSEQANSAITKSISDSQLPQNQKDAFLTASYEIFTALQDGRINFGLDGSFTNPEAATKIIINALKNSFSKIELDTNEQEKFNSQLDRVRSAYLAQKIDQKQFQTMMEKLIKGPFGQKVGGWFIFLNYLQSSGLSQIEKDAAELTVSTAINAMANEKVTQQDFSKILAPYQETNAQGKKVLKQNLTDEELKTILSEVDALLAEREIKKESYKISVGDELKAALDEAKID